MAARTRRPASGADTWAGFVDALSTLLVVLIFALVVFMLAQFFQGITLSGRDEALARLEDRVAELADMLALERDGNVELRLEIAQLSADLQRVNAARDDTEQALAILSSERDGLIARLSATEDYASQTGAALDEAQARLDLLQSDLDRALEDVTVTKDTLSLKLAELASLQRDIDALNNVRENLEAEVGRMVLLLEEAEDRLDEAAQREAEATAELEDRQARIDALLLDLSAERDRGTELASELSDETERTFLAQQEVEEREIRLSELAVLVTLTEEERDEAQSNADRRLNQIGLLNQQLNALRDQIAALNDLLEAAEAQAEADQVQIADLGSRLNAALAAKVQELSRFRSEFFARLVDVLGDRDGIKIVGDRFVLQSELLFESGSADISNEGKRELDKIAELIIELTAEIPSDVAWILRVDGHTDSVPIATAAFPSNWELSTARATAVVRYMIGQGVLPGRLAATGFGEYHPIVEGDDNNARQRNRRIEFKLTEQ